ncbi:MAG: DUF6134 family protein [Gammaproteobacteria bacterium]|nr:DUF6134 family protein [Gammaproteobacteria bacterium]
MTLTRRAALRAVAGVIAGAAGLTPARTRAADCAIEAPRDLAFDVYRGSKNIGTHSITFASGEEGLRATTRVSLTVKLAFITLLDLNHESVEIWRGNRLRRLDSTTREGSETFEVHGEAVDEGFRVESEDGIVTAAAGIMTTNTVWDACILGQSEVIDAQHGGLVGLVVNRLGTEAIEVGKRKVDAARAHFVLPGASGDLWFAASRLVKARFEVKSEVVDYRLRDDEPDTAAG